MSRADTIAPIVWLRSVAGRLAASPLTAKPLSAVLLKYMLVPKRANYQYRYGAAQYRYWYPYSNSLVVSFLSAIFPKYDSIH